jgi:hypothetical protein
MYFNNDSIILGNVRLNNINQLLDSDPKLVTTYIDSLRARVLSDDDELACAEIALIEATKGSTKSRFHFFAIEKNAGSETNPHVMWVASDRPDGLEEYATRFREILDMSMSRTLELMHLLYGVTDVTVEFYGGGDSGQIENIELFVGEDRITSKTLVYYDVEDGNTVAREPEIVFPDIPVYVCSERYNPEARACVTTCTYTARTVFVAIEEHVYAALEECGVDWYNNDGGSGTYAFYRDNGAWEIDLHVYVNEITSRLAHCHSEKLGEEEA